MPENVLERLTGYARATLSDDIGPTTPLVSSGLLKSVETARLLAFVNSEFGVRVPLAKLGRDNFETLETIAGVVQSLVDSHWEDQ
jgi:acyl carrier protein